jgi:integrase
VFPKYVIITSHDLRRSFATNFFGKIPTPILMNMTGHSRETTFMSYIGKDQNQDRYADEFMQGVSTIEM